MLFLLLAILPTVSDPQVQEILDGELIFYDHAPAYQDWDGALKGVHSTLNNVAGRHDPFGNGNREFPWGSPAGTHRSDVSTSKFLHLPLHDTTRSDDHRWPVVWWKDGRQYEWTFPVGTVVGEVLQLRTPAGELITFEMRVRIREHGEWAVDVFRPYPTAGDFVARVKELRPNWNRDNRLAVLLTQLEGPIPPPILRLHRHTFDRRAGVDVLPAIDEGLVHELLDTTFHSSLGQTWRRGAHAPTTKAGFHIIPKNYDAGFIAVDRFSCASCHEDVNRNVNDFDSKRSWYGNIRGSDGIFSFHIFDSISISHNGHSKAVVLNTELPVEQYDAAKHPANIYQRTRK